MIGATQCQKRLFQPLIVLDYGLQKSDQDTHTHLGKDDGGLAMIGESRYGEKKTQLYILQVE